MNLTGFFDEREEALCDIETKGLKGREWGNDGRIGNALDEPGGAFIEDAARGEETYGIGDDALRAGCTVDMVIAAVRDISVNSQLCIAVKGLNIRIMLNGAGENLWEPKGRWLKLYGKLQGKLTCWKVYVASW